MLIHRRELLVGTAALAVSASIPTLPSLAAPTKIIPAWVVGSEGESNWQHIIAKTEREALRFFAQECGDYEEECAHDSRQDGCDCCEAIDSYMAERKPMWDGRPYDSITPGDWLRSGTGHICSRCSYETFPEEGGRGVGDEAVCEECMTLADWDAVDPERAAEIRADQ